MEERYISKYKISDNESKYNNKSFNVFKGIRMFKEKLVPDPWGAGMKGNLQIKPYPLGGSIT